MVYLTVVEGLPSEPVVVLVEEVVRLLLDQLDRPSHVLLGSAHFALVEHLQLLLPLFVVGVPHLGLLAVGPAPYQGRLTINCYVEYCYFPLYCFLCAFIRSIIFKYYC